MANQKEDAEVVEVYDRGYDDGWNARDSLCPDPKQISEDHMEGFQEGYRKGFKDGFVSGGQSMVLGNVTFDGRLDILSSKRRT